MALKVYDIRSRTKSEFKPVHDDKVHVYVCGMTVQGPPHVGHLRAAIVADSVRRYLTASGYEVVLVHNFTDVDDKIIEKSTAEGVDYWEIANRNIEAYDRAIEALNVQPPTITPRASEHIPDIIALIEDLIAKGHAYASPRGDVYFEVGTHSPYGELSGCKVEELRAGQRIDVDDEKKHPEDFALWKAAKPGEPSWPSPWSDGRPGWHIECSAMAMRYCGETLDFHGGGVDLIFPHHENEIAQSRASTGKVFANHWMHHGMVNLGGEKMSKSSNHFFLATDVFARVDPQVVRFYLLTTHFRSPIEFSEERLAEAGGALGKLLKFVAEGAPGHPEVGAAALAADLEGKFSEAMDDDFNTAKAIGLLFEFVRDVNRRLAEAGADSSQVPEAAAGAVEKYLQLLGMRVVAPAEEEAPSAALQLLEARNAARAVKDWAKADEARDQLKDMGFAIEDRASGSVLRKV